MKRILLLFVSLFGMSGMQMAYCQDAAELNQLIQKLLDRIEMNARYVSEYNDLLQVVLDNNGLDITTENSTESAALRSSAARTTETEVKDLVDSYNKYNTHYVDDVIDENDVADVAKRILQTIDYDPLVVDGSDVKQLFQNIDNLLKNNNEMLAECSALLSNSIKYTELNPLLTEHEYVDLGVVVNGRKVLWAKSNVGAEHEYDFGNYYAWGELDDKAKYNWNTYEWCDEDEYHIKKYSTNSEDFGSEDGKVQLIPADDVAFTTLGGCWRIPTKEEYQGLIDQCNWSYVNAGSESYGGKSGYKVSNKQDESKFIFLPLAGYHDDENPQYEESQIVDLGYWTSTLHDQSMCNAWILTIFGEEITVFDMNRCIGGTIRPVFTVYE